MATVSDVQAKIDAGVAALQKTTSSYSQMVNKYGMDWKQWPNTTNWYKALTNIEAARTEVGGLTVSTLTAKFTEKVA